MSKFKVVRAGLLGSAAALAFVGTANAVEAEFGDVQITFDTTVSMGASMLTQDRETDFLPEVNGGPVDPRADATLGAVVLGNGALLAPFNGFAPGANLYTANPRSNFDGSVNTDDGRLNFDKGDFIGANVKANHDFQMTWHNYKLFARAVGFYDVVMNDEGAGNRSKLTDDALGDVGRNYELLDLFISADYTLADIPVNLRAGKQVINWGESTFILNGLNVFNPIDVASFRRPGSEIKEALVPVNAVYASVSLPWDMSVAGYYALDWEPFEIDPSGTPFSGADSVAFGTGVGGNFINGEPVSFVTASPFSANRRNCIAAAGTGTRFVQTAGGLLFDPTTFGLVPSVAGLNNNMLDCSDSAFVSHVVPTPVGQHELVRLSQINTLANDGVSFGTTGIHGRGQDHEARDDGQYGIKMSLFLEELNGTEVGFYFQNYHSRLPIVNIEADPTDTAADFSYFLNSTSTDLPSGLQGRQLNNAGCGITNPAQIGTIGAAGLLILDSDPLTPGNQSVFTAASSIGGAIGALGNPLTPGTAAFQMANTPVADPAGQLAAAAAAVTVLSGGNVTLNNGLANGFRNQLAVAQLNCVLTYYQSGLVTPAGTTATTVQSFDGAEFVLANMDANVVAQYPEDIEVWGFSFNTTVGSWGLQGEMSYRPNAPFQVDTDSLTIAGLVNGCTFTQLYGAAGLQLAAAATPDATGVKARCGSQDGISDGAMRHPMYTGQLGTTSTFTGSDWFVQSIGADLAVLVTEVGMVYVPNVEETWIDNLPARPANGGIPGVKYKDSYAQFANTGCQGTDLPLAGALSLDTKGSAQCRPTNFSAGLVMLLRAEYNNFMDTGFAVAPQLVYAWDFEGTTAAPYSNYLEDRQSIGVGVTGTLNNNFRVGVNYNNFFGGHVNNKSRDRDFASFSASYTF